MTRSDGNRDERDTVVRLITPVGSRGERRASVAPVACDRSKDVTATHRRTICQLVHCDGRQHSPPVRASQP